jgi:hypothetical protein
VTWRGPLAKTEAFERSRRDSKRIAMLLAHLKPHFSAQSSALAWAMRCRIYISRNRAKPSQARKARRPTPASAEPS